MAELANCPWCHGLFMKGPAAICRDCVKQEEDDFQTVYSFVRQKKNRTATVPDIVRETGVEEYKIREFVKAKRLHPTQFPGLAYSCEKCGTDIKDGRMCESCTGELKEGVQKQEKMKQAAQKGKKEDLGQVTYYSVKGNNR
ncbi:TIGR03826 family flagellar region protein [Halobacillus sp. A5]|uniref:TIGR03826 family flagellar region protein n=1 Tax=Halobacillus sp. A5 TaxID=2880263 RepID=UPI0020A6617A|nr:TIGR03826 family flagellar region protein [Halobacillus sp. A5]MCP3028098.1 flagellar protein YvyF [Halobacillus sp. A5]